MNTVNNGLVKECCMHKENLIDHQERSDLVIKICKVCGCRHFELTVDPGKIFSHPADDKPLRFY